MKQTAQQHASEKLIDNLESIRNLRSAAMLNLGRAEHQASHKMRSSGLDKTAAWIELE